MGLRERVEWILKERGITARELSRRAGLAAEQHVSTILKRLKEDGAAGPGHKTLVALAKGGGVSVHWLVTGEGEPEGTGRAVEHDERYPNRARAIATAREWRLPEEAIQVVASMALQSDDDPPPDWWYEQIKLHAAIAKGKASLGREMTDDDFEPRRKP